VNELRMNESSMIVERLTITKFLNFETSSMSSSTNLARVDDVDKFSGTSNDEANDSSGMPNKDDDKSPGMSSVDFDKTIDTANDNVDTSSEEINVDIVQSLAQQPVSNANGVVRKAISDVQESQDKSCDDENKASEEIIASDHTGDECADEENDLESQTDHRKDTNNDDSVCQHDVGNDCDESPIVRQINTGRWSAREHELFLEGLEKYGKEWKRVAGNVGTRSVMQTRTHAQKHFDRFKPGGGKGGIWGTDKPSSSRNSAGASYKGVKRSASEANEDSKGGGEVQVKGEDHHPEAVSSQDASDFEKRRSQEAIQYTYGDSFNYSKPGYTLSQTVGSTIHARGLTGGHGYALPPPVYSNVRLNPSTTTPSRMDSPHVFVGGPYAADRPSSPQSDPYNAPYPSSDYYNVHTVGGSSDYRGGRSGIPFSDRDILLPMTIHTIKSVANREYIDLLRANCCIYHALPSPDQVCFVRNICNFLRVVRRRQWFISHQQWGTPMPLGDPSALVAAEFRQDSLKYAALQFHPYWLLGDHDTSIPHRSDPFAYRRSDGTWIPIDRAEAREVLLNEGPKTLLVLPPSIEIKENSSH
jgi:SHAQKYF class myb-like DNA-binding protein